MATPPVFTAGEILTAAQMNGVGSWLVKSQTIGTGVSTVTVTGAFTSDYNSYRVVMSNVTMSSTPYTTSMYLKMHDGTNPVSTNYNFGISRVDLASGSVSGTKAQLGTAGIAIGQGTGSLFGTVFDVINPNLAAYTLFPNLTIVNDSVGYCGSGAGMHQAATAYTAFQILPTTGTLTGGTISIYGYRS
jgi:hypothetical protein